MCGDILLSFKSYANRSAIPIFARVYAGDEDASLVCAVILMEDNGSGGWNFVPLTRVGDYYYYLRPIFQDPECNDSSITLCYAAYVMGAFLDADQVAWELGGNKVDVIQSVRVRSAVMGNTFADSGWFSPWMCEDDVANAMMN